MTHLNRKHSFVSICQCTCIIFLLYFGGWGAGLRQSAWITVNQGSMGLKKYFRQRVKLELDWVQLCSCTRIVSINLGWAPCEHTSTGKTLDWNGMTCNLHCIQSFILGSNLSFTKKDQDDNRWHVNLINISERKIQISHAETTKTDINAWFSCSW